jgi:multidrug efflux system membrane fusion protein
MNIGDMLASRPWLVAGLITAAVVAWLASGTLQRATERAAENSGNNGPAQPQTDLLRVQVRTQDAEPVTRFISVYGRTAPARTVEIKAETNGRIVAIETARGKYVRAGTPILRLDLRDRQARLDQARASLAQHQVAYEGQIELKSQGYVSETQIAETLAKLETSRAELVRAELDLEYMVIRAPFDGILQERTVEEGDFVRAGDPVATFVDNTRLIVTGSIAEQDVKYVAVNNQATAKLVTGQSVKGRLRYLAPVADASTRTFTVELEIPNGDGALPAGVTAEMQIPAGEMLAHKVSPALLSLAADGQVGVKTVDALNRVVFTPVEIARSEPDGVWITGLPTTASIITVGQGYVSAGQAVKPIFAEPDRALAAERAQGAQPK